MRFALIDGAEPDIAEHVALYIQSINFRSRRALLCRGLDDFGDRREQCRVVAGHAVHRQHAGDDGGGDLLLDRLLGEGLPHRRRLAVAVAAPLDLRHLDRRIAQIVGDEGARRGAAR